jgi:hypothetical protein
MQSVSIAEQASSNSQEDPQRFRVVRPEKIRHTLLTRHATHVHAGNEQNGLPMILGVWTALISETFGVEPNKPTNASRLSFQPAAAQCPAEGYT